jgi:hypothetical protein
VYHLFNPKGIGIDDLILYLERSLERKVARVGFEQWVENIKAFYAAANPEEVPVFVKSLDLLPRERSAGVFTSPGTRAVKPISCGITTAELARYGIKCPEPDSTLIQNYCRFLKKAVMNVSAEEYYESEIRSVQP